MTAATTAGERVASKDDSRVVLRVERMAVTRVDTWAVMLVV